MRSSTNSESRQIPKLPRVESQRQAGFWDPRLEELLYNLAGHRHWETTGRGARCSWTSTPGSHSKKTLTLCTREKEKKRKVRPSRDENVDFLNKLRYEVLQ